MDENRENNNIEMEACLNRPKPQPPESVCLHKCKRCGNNRCRHFKRRSLVGSMNRFLISLTLGVFTVTVLFGCFIFIHWGINYLFSDYFGSDLVRFYPPESSYQMPPSGSEDGKDKLRVGLGVMIAEIGNEASFAGLEGGLIIMEINPTSAFDGTDVAVNDIIVGIDGKTIIGFDDFDSIIKKHQVGDEISVALVRFSDGQPVKRIVTVNLISLGSN